MSTWFGKTLLRLMIAFLVMIGGIAGLGSNAFANQIFTAAFHNNIPGISDTSIFQSASSPMPLQAFSTMGFSNPNFFFVDWSTQPGGGTIYPDQAPYSFTADVDLYAQWVQLSHSVSFYSNLTNADTIHVTQTTNAPTSLTAFSTMGFSNASYNFAGWNTQRDGSGMNYSDQASYSFSTDLSLFAHWVLDAHAANFYSNLTNTDTIHVTQTSNLPATLTPYSTLNFSNPNYTFAGWNTQRDGSGVSYPDQSSYAFLADVNLYAQWAQNPHTVTFFSNDNSADVNHVTQTTNVTSPLNAVATLNFSNPNYTFAGWNTQRDGSGVSYPDQASYPFLADVNLYAQWAQNPHTVTFYRNDSTNDGERATQTSGASSNLTSLVVLAFTNPDHTFVGWNTQRDGNGVSYRDGANFKFSSDVILYGQWAQNSFTVLFSPNSGIGATESLSAAPGGEVSLPSGSSLAKPGYVVVGWNTTAQGTGIQYPLGARISPTADETLYAQWARTQIAVTFTGPGASGGVAPIKEAAGLALRLPSGAALVKPGFTFVGWYSAPVAGVFVGSAGATISPTSSMVIYARWKSNPLVTLAFSDNGGTGRVSSHQVRSGLNVVIPDGAALHRTAYAFSGWATSSHAARPNVRINSRLVLTHSITLYAVWHLRSSGSTPQVLLGSVGAFAVNSATLTSSMRRNIAALARTINQHQRRTLDLYGYATSQDSRSDAVVLSRRRAQAVQRQMRVDLTGLHDVGVAMHAVGEGKLLNSVLASFRNVEVFAS